jgi:H+-transporting ATPase
LLPLRIPLLDVDQAALTGESLPVNMFRGDSCKMGSTVSRGEVNATVEFTGANTFFGKTAALLGATDEYSNLQMILVTIMLVLVVASMILSWTVFFYILSDQGAISALSFTVVLLVASIPLAMEVVTTTTLALGSKELSHHGAIVARLAAIEDMAGMSILCSDKTGTLTMNQMQIQEQTPIYKKGESQYSLLRYGAMAAKWHEPPRDALDTLTLTAADLKSLDKVTQLAYMPFDPIVKRTEGTVRENGIEYKTTKGAPHVLLKLVKEQAGADKAEVDRVAHLVEADVHELGTRGIRSLAVAKTNPEKNNQWEMLGLLTFLDPPRPDTKQTVADARAYGVMVKMITGDHLLIARETSKQLDLGLNIYNAEGLPLLDMETKKKPENLSRDYGDLCLAADGFAQVFPEHKYLVVECLRELGYKTGMTGDGVNDAPALKRADVGIAVHGATDAARAAADIILTQPGLSTIILGLKISRGIFCRIKNFITYRVAATLQLLVFFFMATFLFKPSHYQPNPLPAHTQDWPDFFHMPVLMLMLITVLNDGTLISIGYDNVSPSKFPEKWNLKALFLIGSVLAGVALISSLLLLWMLLDSNNDGSVFQGMGIPGLSYGQVTTSIYLKVSISDFLTLFSARTGPDPFWSTTPARILMGAACFSLSLSTVIACSWPATYPDHIYTVGLARDQPYALALYIWIYCIFWWFIQVCI